MSLFTELEYMQVDYFEGEIMLTKEQVIRQAVAELSLRENIVVEPDVDIKDLVWSYNTYFGIDAAFDLNNDYIRADVHTRESMV